MLVYEIDNYVRIILFVVLIYLCVEVSKPSFNYMEAFRKMEEKWNSQSYYDYDKIKTPKRKRSRASLTRIK